MDNLEAIGTRGSVQRIFNWSTAVTLILCSLALALLVWCYYPGFSGPFLFDDEPNLAPLSLLEGELSWDRIKLYLNTGVAGPSGRPLSLLSFLANAQDWPTSAWPFKYTNVLLHALNTVLIFWLSLSIIRWVKGDTGSGTAIAGVIALFWAFNPYHASTVLYVVQRMAMLSAFFVLLGLILYFRGRVFLQDPRRQYVGMGLVFAAYLVAGVGVLAKENAALFVLMVPLIEWLFFSRGVTLSPALSKLLSWIVVIPAGLFILGMAFQWSSFSDEYRWFRDFTLGERLLSQLRALGYYLWRYLIPGTDYIGLYGGGFAKSTGLFTPFSTFGWLIGHLALIGIVVSLRKAAPLLAFGVLFFYVGHAMESSFVPLELVFEHRNYLPSAFLLLPLAALPGRKIILSGLALTVVLAAVFLRAEASTWSDGTTFLRTQLERNPESARVVEETSAWYFNHGLHAEAVDLLRSYAEANEANMRLRMRTLQMACEVDDVTPEDIRLFLESGSIHTGPPELIPVDIERLSRFVQRGACANLDYETLRAFLENVRPKLTRSPEGQHAYFASHATLALHARDYPTYRDAVMGAVRSHPNALYTLNTCPVLASASRDDACTCLTSGAQAFVGGNGVQSSLTRSLLGFADQLRVRYESVRQHFCRPQ